MHKCENMFRPAYECVSAIGWCVAAIVMLYISGLLRHPFTSILVHGRPVHVLRSPACLPNATTWKFRISLAGKPFLFMKVPQVLAYMKRQPSKLFLGFGFSGNRAHSGARDQAPVSKVRATPGVVPEADEGETAG